jgi:uncharacterized protein YceK
MKYLLLILIGLSGCSTVLQQSEPTTKFPASNYYLVHQTMPDNLSQANCGAQALGTVTASLQPPGIQFSQQELKVWDHDGATPLDVLIRARLAGFSAEVQLGNWQQLLQQIKSDTHTLVEFDSTIEVWTPFGFFRRPRSQSLYHWSAVTGIAKDGSAILLAAPHGRDYIIRHDSFMRRWSRADDCLITIALPP